MLQKFKNEIYPFGLSVAIDEPLDNLCKSFQFYNNNDVLINLSESDLAKITNKMEACTVKVCDKETNLITVLLMFETNGTNIITYNTICHECSHASDLLCDMQNVKYGTFETGEAHAYICGWIGSCIEKTLYYKNK